ncbi:MAG: nitrate- and nitrite sensing domain-containing protein, partial [Devosiaceae bacterium]|nr:nitrate- and nitrite sensing domain-containing protein [Devosiaceae bacterium]
MTQTNPKFSFQQFLSRFPVKVRILALCLIPLAGMLFIGFQQMVQEFEYAAEAEKTLQMAAKVPTVSSLVHELQVERGMSAGFSASGGVQFADEMIKQRQITNAVVEELQKYLTAEELAKLDADISAELKLAMLGLGELENIRSRISSDQISKGDLVAYFSSTIGDLLKIVELQIAHAGNSEIVTQLMALDALLTAKEKAGIERAVGTGIFAAGTVSEALYLKFAALVTSQNEYLEIFSRIATPELAQVLQDTHKGPIVENVDALRAILQRAPFGGSLASVSGERWFSATTDRINLLKIVDDAATAKFVEYLVAFQSEAARRLQSTLVLNGALLLITLVLAFIVIRSITGPIVRLTKTMDKISHGEFDTAIQGVQNHDELGKMARAVEIFKENGLKVAAMTEEEKATLARNAAERTEMMQELGHAFGDVVGAAVAGDFSQRVSAEFPDDELNQLGVQVNQLVETVERGLNETGMVLGALANTDLTRRVEGDYQGAFLDLKNDTNAVADKLSEVIGQLRNTSGELKSATGEILAGANDLSERTTKQAATVEQTSASVEQL